MEKFGDFANRHRFMAAFGMMLISSLLLLPELNAEMRGDVVVFHSIANDLFQGTLPYRDRVVEYPPYAIPVFLLPRLFGEDNYLDGFLSLAFIADWLIKLSLFAIGLRQSKTARALLPLLLYCASVPFIHFFFLQRYDLWPALTSLLAIWLFSSQRYLCQRAGGCHRHWDKALSHFICAAVVSAGLAAGQRQIIFCWSRFRSPSYRIVEFLSALVAVCQVSSRAGPASGINLCCGLVAGKFAGIKPSPMGLHEQMV